MDAGQFSEANVILLCLAFLIGGAAGACVLRRILANSLPSGGFNRHLARKRGRRLAEMMRLFAMAEEIAELGIWQYYPEEGLHEWSAGMKSLFGLDAEDELLPGDAETLLGSSGTDLVGEIMARKERRGTFGLRLSIRRVDGVEREVKLRASHLRDARGRSERVVAVLIDVSDIARRERRLRQSREIALREAERAKELSESDPLTGLANRRRVMADVDRLVLRHRDRGEPLSLISFDLDHFKRVNDTFGHPAGDKVLRQIAIVASRQAREGDLVGRLGGEEFVWVLPGADRHFAQIAAERLRLAIAMCTVGDNEMGVTASIGIATVEPNDTALSLFARADRALYEAKNSGRNRVRIAA